MNKLILKFIAETCRVLFGHKEGTRFRRNFMEWQLENFPDTCIRLSFRRSQVRFKLLMGLRLAEKDS